MSEYDLHSNIDTRVALQNLVIGSDTTTPGEIIDTVGFESIEFVVQSGFINAGDFAILLEEGDDAGLSDAATVPPDQILGTIFGLAVGDNAVTIRTGSIGKKRYQRLTIVSTGGASGSNQFSAVAILGNPHAAPVPQTLNPLF